MKKTVCLLSLLSGLVCLSSCKGKNTTLTTQSISDLNLKRGDVVVCGPADKQFGTVEFTTSCSPNTKKDFDLAIALLHSFEYDEAEKVFAKVIEQDPECAMAYWGVAMSNYHPLWAPPTSQELEKGAKAITMAQSLSQQQGVETEYINAMALFYKNWNTTDHRTRSHNYRNAMEKIYTNNPANKEAAIFYALALNATADPTDKSFVNQKKAGDILTALYPEGPNHPGIVHYIIHTYDYPELATLALPAARKYAAIAPSSAHAQHMPSHIFTRLGLWDECIQSNLVAASSAKCYAENAGLKGHWDEELHALDYLVYGYLQKGQNKQAKEQWDYLRTIKEVHPINFKVLYAFASIPSRYVLENKLWKEAASLETYPANFPWEKFPWQRAIIHFTRLLGNVHTGRLDSAKMELRKMQILRDTLLGQKNVYEASQVEVQIKTGEAWIFFGEEKNEEAVKLMNTAAGLEDKTEKHPVTPGEVLPARELLGDMLLQMNKPAGALIAYEADLKKHPNRFNGLYGAALASEKTNNTEKAKYYYGQLLAVANSSDASRAELKQARSYLKK
ncbi:tetratricopeptide repeat protein [Terrimonas alba]|uniref:tetratricopeptide repeat protein n=1 Tax=Terrimonas alba TaxID=3349636 RepID=UPI0035F44B1E